VAKPFHNDRIPTFSCGCGDVCVCVVVGGRFENFAILPLLFLVLVIMPSCVYDWWVFMIYRSDGLLTKPINDNDNYKWIRFGQTIYLILLTLHFVDVAVF
jgi:hypothetical protein